VTSSSGYHRIPPASSSAFTQVVSGSAFTRPVLNTTVVSPSLTFTRRAGSRAIYGVRFEGLPIDAVKVWIGVDGLPLGVRRAAFAAPAASVYGLAVAPMTLATLTADTPCRRP
jgi:hypothetical protein